MYHVIVVTKYSFDLHYNSISFERLKKYLVDGCVVLSECVAWLFPTPLKLTTTVCWSVIPCKSCIVMIAMTTVPTHVVSVKS